MGIDTDQIPINDAFTAAIEALKARIDALEAGGGGRGDLPNAVHHVYDNETITYSKD